MVVSFVGAGPGDPELITLKGKKCLEAADVVIYAGSLVNPDLLEYCKSETKIYNSAGMDLQEVLKVMVSAVKKGEVVVRLHTGDPSIYGAIQEQMDELEKEGIEYQVVPGVSAFSAAAAALKRELTLPGITQTVILSRTEGRTPVPEKEKLQELARLESSLCLFLSIQIIAKVASELMEVLPADTPVAVVEKASWPQERIVKGTLVDISEKVEKAGIKKTALIIVGKAVATKEYELSKLYDASFTHEYREAKTSE